MANYHPIVCQACHNVVLVDGMDPWAHRTLVDAGWTHDGKDYVCCGKEKAKPVRPSVQIFVRWTPQAKFSQKVGFQAAAQGYECLNADPDYKIGYDTGMTMRGIAANLPFKEAVK